MCFIKPQWKDRDLTIGGLLEKQMGSPGKWNKPPAKPGIALYFLSKPTKKDTYGLDFGLSGEGFAFAFRLVPGPPAKVLGRTLDEGVGIVQVVPHASAVPGRMWGFIKRCGIHGMTIGSKTA